VQYFLDIWAGIATTYKGMRLTLTYFFRPKVTMRYPEERPVIHPGHRGIHGYKEEDCLLCRACEIACPVDCLVINALGRGKDKLILTFDIDYSKCLFCNLCCEACNPKCLFMTERYDMAATDHSACLINFARLKSEQEIRAYREALAKKEAEKKAAQEKKEPDPCEDDKNGNA
jgi:NADH-quinone oxidoreductase subunit I